MKKFGASKLYQRQFTDLMSHYSEIKKHGECYNIQELWKLAGNQIELPNHEVLLDIYGKMIINSFLIPDEYLNKIGTGLYLSTSKLDHCCAPNCVYTYNGTEQIIRALTYIEQPSPDKMFVTYIDNAMPSWERRLQLNENYYFYCQCSWCVDEAKNIDRLMTSVKCPNSWCFGFFGITKDDTGQIQLLSCSSCGKTDFPIEYAREIVRLWVYGTKRIKELKEMDRNEDYQSLLELAENVLAEFDKSSMHESNLQFIRIREMAKGACIELKLWQKAVEYGELAWTQKIKCVPHPSPSLGLQLFEQGKLLTNTGNIDKAREIFLKAANILQITHGTENNIYLELEDLIVQCEIVLDLPV